MGMTVFHVHGIILEGDSATWLQYLILQYFLLQDFRVSQGYLNTRLNVARQVVFCD